MQHCPVHRGDRYTVPGRLELRSSFIISFKLTRMNRYVRNGVTPSFTGYRLYRFRYRKKDLEFDTAADPTIQIYRGTFPRTLHGSLFMQAKFDQRRVLSIYIYLDKKRIVRTSLSRHVWSAGGSPTFILF